jgi:hypothetical protein
MTDIYQADSCSTTLTTSCTPLIPNRSISGCGASATRRWHSQNVRSWPAQARRPRPALLTVGQDEGDDVGLLEPPVRS